MIVKMTIMLDITFTLFCTIANLKLFMLVLMLVAIFFRPKVFSYVFIPFIAIPIKTIPHICSSTPFLYAICIYNFNILESVSKYVEHCQILAYLVFITENKVFELYIYIIFLLHFLYILYHNFFFC